MKDPATGRNEARTYVSFDEEHLFGLIPDYLLDYEGTKFSHAGKIAAGRKFFEAMLPAFQERICVKWEYCKKRNDPDLQDTVTLVMSVADVIATACGSVPPFVISSLLVKKSLNALCQCK